MKTFTCIILAMSLLVGCKKTTNTVVTDHSSSTQTVAWKDAKNFPIESIVEDIEYIMFEETEGSLFSGIDKLIVKGNRIYLLDMNGSRSLLCFDLSGKFLHQVGGVGGGPGEYGNRGTINFDVSDGGDVFIYDIPQHKMLKYDKNGKYLQTIQSAYDFNDFCVLSDESFLLAAGRHGVNNAKAKVIRSKDLQTTSEAFFTFDEDDKDNKFNIRSFQGCEEGIYYMNPVSDTLYVFDRAGKICDAYYFDFGSRKLPADLKKDYEQTIQARRSGLNYEYISNPPMRVGDYMFLELLMGNKKAFSAVNMTNGLSTYIELTPENFSVNHINFPLCTIGNNTIVSYMDADIYTSVKERIVIPEVDKFIKDGGFVLCLYKIK
jgi:hypothetical protein